MFKKTEKLKYYFLNETCVDEEISRKHLKPIRENTVELDGKKYQTLTYHQVLQSFGLKNWNGRDYVLEETLKSIDNNPLIQWDMKHNSWGCEYGHPLIEKGMNELQRQMTIFPQNSCNTIDRYWVEGNLLMGECTTLYGSWGEILKGRIITGFPAMASSRAIGAVDSRGKVLPGYTVITFDTVIRPSHKEAYMIKNSERVNTFTSPSGNSMNENVSEFSLMSNKEAFDNFILTESKNEKIEMLLDTMGLDYGSMKVDGKFIVIESVNENSRDKVFVPIKQVVSSELYNVFFKG